MLTFFRRFRKGLRGDGATSKYLQYAIGEIALVVIGILIALQINNWNEDRKIREIEHVLLLSLREEVNKNQHQLTKAISYTKRSMNSAKLFVNIYQTDQTDLNYNELDSILGQIQWAWTYDPVMGVPISIRTSGQLNTIRNADLRLFVASFEEIVRDVQEEGLLLRDMIIEQFMPMIGKYVSSNNRSSYIGKGYAIVKNSIFESDYEGLFADRESENLITYIHVWRYDQLSEEIALSERLEEVLEIINAELLRWD